MTIAQAESPEELKLALRRLIYRPGYSKADIDHQVRALLHHAESRSLSFEHCLLLRSKGEIAASCLSVDSPGRTSAIYIPVHLPDDHAIDQVTALVRHAAEQAQQRHICFLQAIIPLDASVEERVLIQAAFERLAELIYMEHDLIIRHSGDSPSEHLAWKTYSPGTHGLFAQVVHGTYEGTLDCARLSGLRDIEDILATHRATGVFDPRMWFVGLLDRDPVGVLLLSRMPEASAVEVVYMGLLPQWRGHGYARLLIDHGIRIAGEQAALRLTLAVDAVNKPARKLYSRSGFREITRRCAWIRVLPPGGARDISRTIC